MLPQSADMFNLKEKKLWPLILQLRFQVVQI